MALRAAKIFGENSEYLIVKPVGFTQEVLSEKEIVKLLLPLFDQAVKGNNKQTKL